MANWTWRFSELAHAVNALEGERADPARRFDESAEGLSEAAPGSKGSRCLSEPARRLSE